MGPFYLHSDMIYTAETDVNLGMSRDGSGLLCYVPTNLQSLIRFDLEVDFHPLEVM